MGDGSPTGVFFSADFEIPNPAPGAGRAVVGTSDFPEDDYVKSQPAQVV
jgi:hypothetical protein